MRRAAVLLSLVAAVVTGTAFALGAGGGDGQARVDVIFDNVFGVVPGQDVRVAGATVGSVEALSVTADRRARIRMAIDPRFAGFRSDASCTIQPQSLIGEKFVQCSPGTPSGDVLPAGRDGVPTVPVENTVAPVDLSLVLGTFNRPTRERLGILLGSLGSGLAGRGDDLAQAIRRAAPALTETNRVLGVLDRDRARLRQLADDGDVVLAALANRRDRIADFVKATSTVAQTSAERRERLAEAVRGLPALLGEAQPALDRLGGVMRDATPLARELRGAAPDVAGLLGDTERFAQRAAPTLDALAPTLTTLRKALPVLEPQTRRLRRFSVAAVPAIDKLEDLLTSARDNGALDGLAGFFYFTSSAVARFDKYGHYLPAYEMGGGTCGLYATTAVAGCSGHVGGNPTKQRASERRTTRRRAEGKAARPDGSVPVPGRAPVRPQRPGLPGLPDLKQLVDPQQLPQVLRDAVGPLLGEQRRRGRQDDSLLEYLLG